ncbi:anthranilate phosphoribosyltransferase [Flaviflexus massiliensis]|uniref:anthranilate phosphoribosyltransferase n=1 Tax=Flaviflexus massiliensis TaxID=1522309 RepID=UPI0006D55E34|nr:anthranilate phosphoribosyltransferase [Flaviflexus massiliensis]
MSRRTWSDLTARLIRREDLDTEDTRWAMDEVMSGLTSPVVLAGFLTALATKGETTDELRGLADAMLEHAKSINIDRDTLDIVGTGGDRMKTINISTMSSIVIAAAGVKVVKHGNRASSSASGSADCLEALGVDLNLPVKQVISNFEELGITFLFANLFHPSMRHAGVARKELGVGTAFNVLGPLTNPARPRAGAIGVSSAHHAPIVAGVLAGRGTDALVFRGDNGMDELNAVSVNHVWEVHDGKVEYSIVDAVKDLGLSPATVEDLRGEDAVYNANVARRIFAGEKGAGREAVLLNVAGALVAYGRAPGVDRNSGTLIERLRAGLDIARDTIDSGKAEDLLSRWVSLSQAE